MSLSEYVRILGRGPGRSRSLEQGEAHDAMTHMLADDASPEAVGAILMLLRMKGETAAEIAGFTSAARATLPEMPSVDLDWSSYAAGRTRGEPWFLLSAKLVAQAGYRVLLHGWNGADTKVRLGLRDARIGVAENARQASQLLKRDRIAYLPLETLHPSLFRLLGLRDVLGLRSCINTVCRMLNPAHAPASVQGVFHPSYRLLQADAAGLLGWDNLTVIKGGGGEFERNPAKDIAGFGLREGTMWEATFEATMNETRKLSDPSNLSLTSLWTDIPEPCIEAETVIGTAAAAFHTLGEPNAMALARSLWSDRHTRCAA